MSTMNTLRTYVVANPDWMWAPDRLLVNARSKALAIASAVRQVRRIYRDGAASTKSCEIQDRQFRARAAR